MRKLKKCRICLRSQSQIKQRYHRIFKNLEIATMLYYVAGIMIVDLAVHEPSVICKKCLKHLKIAAKIKTTALESEKVFKKITKNDEFRLWKVKAPKPAPKPEETFFQSILLKEETLETPNSTEVQKPEEESMGFNDDFGDFGDFDDNSSADEDFPLKEDDLFEEFEEKNTKVKVKKPYKYSDKFKCWCGAQYTATKRLKEHQMARHEEIAPEKRPRCEKCGKDFKIEAYLQRHIAKMHDGEPKKENKVACSICGKLLVKSALRVHEKKHKPDEFDRFYCDLCGNSFSMKCFLKYHIERIHLKLKKFKCKFCPAEFVHASLLTFHKRQHRDQNQKFECKFCGKSFDRKFCRTIHERIHTNVRPYSCRFCDKTFIHHSDYRRHELKHTGGIPKKEFDEMMAKGIEVLVHPVG